MKTILIVDDVRRRDKGCGGRWRLSPRREADSRNGAGGASSASNRTGVLDVGLPGQDGLVALEVDARPQRERRRLLMVSALDTAKTAVEALANLARLIIGEKV